MHVSSFPMTRGASNRGRFLPILGLGFGLATAGLAGDPWSLDLAIRQALTNNPDALLARQRILAAEAGLRQANAAFWPQVRVGASYIRTDNPMLVFGSALNQQEFSYGLDFNQVPDADNLNAHGLVTLPLYRGGQSSAGRREAVARREAAREMNEAVRQALAFEVSRAFFTVRKTSRFIEATEASVTSFESNLAIARKRFDAGTALKHEVLDVEVRLAQAREDLVRARNARALAHRALGNLLAVEDAVPEIAADPVRLEVPPVSTPPARSELTAASQRREAAEAALQRSKGGHLPRVDLFGRYDYDHGWEFNGSGNSYAAGIQMQWDVWDGHLTQGRVREAEANLESAREQERKLRLAVELEVAQARLNLQEAEQRLAVTGKATEQAAESAQLTGARFEQGLALATQVIDAATALTAARVRRAEAEADYDIAVAALRRALGLPQLNENLP